MYKPKVSVVIPIWNTEKYLEKCLSSIVNQTLREIEIICVDNGSTDSCSKIIEKFAQNDKRIKIISKEHGCLSSARNAGMAAATAPYITFVDSDDWVESRCYEVALKAFEEDSEIDIVCWGANIVNINLDEKSAYIKGARNYHKIKLVGKQDLNTENIFKSTVCVWNKLFRIDIIKENDILYPLNVELEDTAFFYCYIANCKKAFYINEYFYNYIQRKNSGFEKFLSKQSNFIAPRLKNLEFMINYYKKHNLLDTQKKLIYKLFLDWLFADYRDTQKCYESEIMQKATAIAENFQDISPNNILIRALINKKYNVVVDFCTKKDLKIFGNRILGLFNIYPTNRYILKFFGIRIKFKFGKEDISIW